MNSDLRTLVRQSDPILELDTSPVTADATDTLFQSIEMRRGTTMTTDQRTPTKQQPEPRRQRRGWLVAAGVFSVVVLAAAATFLLAGQGDDAAPAAPITTFVAPTTTNNSAGYPGAVEVAEAAIAALNTYDAEAVHGVTGQPDVALLKRPELFGRGTGDTTSSSGALALDAVIGARWSLMECQPSRSQEGRATCTAEYTNSYRELKGLEPLVMDVMTDAAPDGTPIKHRLRFSVNSLSYFQARWADDWAPFIEWAIAQNPELAVELLTGNLPNTSGIDAWTVMFPAYMEQASS
ncbi:MAG: hypothetical protein ACR2N9_10585 [Acidimicrobiia bacterium]